MLTALIVIFLILWTIIGVGALVLLFRGYKIVKLARHKLNELDNLSSQLKTVFKPILDNKTLIVSLLGIITAVTSVFRKNKK